MSEQVTAFELTHDGLTVTATRTRGGYWQLDWPGRDRDDTARIWCTYETARLAAQFAAEKAGRLRPLYAEWKQGQTELAKGLSQFNDDNGGNE